jgi:hypothetical protein
MLRKILATSILVIASTMSFCAQAKAGTADVPFSGNVAPMCTFSNISPGTLATGSLSNYLEGSKSFGTQGSVDLLCNGPATVSVSEPVDNGSTGPSKFPGTYFGSIITAGANSAGSPKAISNKWQGVTNTKLSISPVTTTNIKVSVIRDEGSGKTIQAGLYKFKTTLTSTP